MMPTCLPAELRALFLATSVLTSPLLASSAALAQGANVPAPGSANAARPAPAANAPAAPAANTAPAAPATSAPTAEARTAAAATPGTTVAAQEAEAAARMMEEELKPKPNGLTAAEIVKLALENSPAIKKSTLEYDKAAANRARAKLAFAPRIELLAGYTRVSDLSLPGFVLNIPGLPPPDPNAPASPSPFPVIQNQYVTSARASLPITEIFLTVIPQYKGVERLAESADLQREAQKLQVAYDARVGFFEYARLLGSEAVARASVRVREAGVRELEALVQAGTATQTELARSQAELANAKVLATQAAGGVAIAYERLVQLTGTPIDENRGIGEPFVDIEIGDTPNYDNVLTTAKQARPELLSLRKLEQAREHLLRARKGAQYPSIQAAGGIMRANPNPRWIPADDIWKTTWDVGVNVTWSPNDTALAYTQAQDAETDLRIVREDRRLIEQGIAIEAASAVSAHRTASEDITAKRQQLEAARRYEADQRALLLAGAATPNDVLLAQRDLLGASLQWVDSFISGRIAQAALMKAQGQTGLANSNPGRAP